MLLQLRVHLSLLFWPSRSPRAEQVFVSMFRCRDLRNVVMRAEQQAIASRPQWARVFFGEAGKPSAQTMTQSDALRRLCTFAAVCPVHVRNSFRFLSPWKPVRHDRMESGRKPRACTAPPAFVHSGHRTCVLYVAHYIEEYRQGGSGGEPLLSRRSDKGGRAEQATGKGCPGAATYSSR